ncbi:hypothetical protein ACUHGC_07510 [Testudinibacter sp. P27/CKL/0425]
MIKQKNHKKVTERGKRRVNIFELEKRVSALEFVNKHQARMNGHQIKRNDSVDQLFEELEARVDLLEAKQQPNRSFLGWLFGKLGN